MSPETVRAYPLHEFPIVKLGDNLPELILKSIENSDRELQNGDILVVASKIVSIIENRTVRFDEIEPSQRALEIAEQNGFDPLHVELALRESTEVIRTKGVLITEIHSGLVCNFSGIDKAKFAANGLNIKSGSINRFVTPDQLDSNGKLKK